MRTLLRVSIFTCCVFFAVATMGYFFWYQPSRRAFRQSFEFSNSSLKPSEGKVHAKMQVKANGLKAYALQNGFNTYRCFMIDMSVPSGRQRFFIYNFTTGRVDKAGLVTHGEGSIAVGGELYFSNIPGSNCTSLGKYKIGSAYHGRFGLAYKLHGLDKTNSKAFERFVVLHGHSCVPASEVYPLTICPSLGCPTVAPIFLKKLAGYIDASGKPILLEIYK